MRLTTNPGESLTVIGVLPTVSQKSRAAATVASAVAAPRTTSTSAMAGTGLKKWMPTKRSGRATKPARVVTDRLEVLLAMMASGRRAPAARSSRPRLMSSDSGAASMNRSASAPADDVEPRRYATQGGVALGRR